MNYKCLKTNIFEKGRYKIVPIRSEDRYDILNWRNEQIYHLRQDKPLTKESQDNYFDNVIPQLFDEDKPKQLLFSFLNDGICIGYGGLVHINWVDKNAEISFIMNTKLEELNFESNWLTYLNLIEKLAFETMNFHKIFTYAFDLRPHFFLTIEKAGFYKEAVLKDHVLFNSKYINVVIHSKINNKPYLRKVNKDDIDLTFKWANDRLIRKYSFTQDKILYSDHVNWFTNKVNNSNCVYYILENKQGVALGSIRFDINDNEAILSFFIDPDYFGKGLGNTIMNLGIDNLRSSNKNVQAIIGEVMHENIASNKLFHKNGFEVYRKDSSKTTFRKRI